MNSIQKDPILDECIASKEEHTSIQVQTTAGIQMAMINSSLLAFPYTAALMGLADV